MAFKAKVKARGQHNSFPGSPGTIHGPSSPGDWPRLRRPSYRNLPMGFRVSWAVRTRGCLGPRWGAPMCPRLGCSRAGWTGEAGLIPFSKYWFSIGGGQGPAGFPGPHGSRERGFTRLRPIPRGGAAEMACACVWRRSVSHRPPQPSSLEQGRSRGAHKPGTVAGHRRPRDEESFEVMRTLHVSHQLHDQWPCPRPHALHWPAWHCPLGKRGWGPSWELATLWESPRWAHRLWPQRRLL